MGYYEQGKQVNNNSVLLPELKNLTPSIQNVKSIYSNISSKVYGGNSLGKLIDRKKSYDRI